MEDKEYNKECELKEISPKIDENSDINENLLNYYIEEIIKSFEEDKKDKLIINDRDQEKTLKKRKLKKNIALM